MSESFAAVEPLLKEHAEIEAQLSDASVHADQDRARKLGRRYAELGQIVAVYRAWHSAVDDLEARSSSEQALERPARSREKL